LPESFQFVHYPLFLSGDLQLVLDIDVSIEANEMQMAYLISQTIQKLGSLNQLSGDSTERQWVQRGLKANLVS
jgi:hypothetical protein